MDLSPKEFELLLCEFCKQDLPAHFNVEHDIKNIGGESSGKRQIDTKITGKIGISNILICGEAKYLNEPVGSETIDSIIGKYFSGEIRANKVILFSNEGFTAPAINRAKLYNIELLQPAELGKAIKPIPYIIGIGHLGRTTLGLVGKTAQHTVMSMNPNDYRIIKGEEKISCNQNIYRLLKPILSKIPDKTISTNLSRFTFKDSNVLYELKDKENFHYTADFEIDQSLNWDYLVEYLSAGILYHVNSEQTKFVNLQGNLNDVFQKVISSPTKMHHETKESLIENILNKTDGHVLLLCLADPDELKKNPLNPLLSVV